MPEGEKEIVYPGKTKNAEVACSQSAPPRNDLSIAQSGDLQYLYPR